VCKIVATVGIIGGALWTYVTWVRNTTNEAKKPFLEQRLQTYIGTLQAVANMASAPDEKTKAVGRQKFWEFYHGAMALVETKEVALQMDAIAECLRSKECIKEKPVRALLPGLILACKKSVENEWKVTLGSSNTDLWPSEQEPDSDLTKDNLDKLRH
jgi:hypothetical protein